MLEAFGECCELFVHWFCVCLLLNRLTTKLASFSLLFSQISIYFSYDASGGSHWRNVVLLVRQVESKMRCRLK